MTETVDAVVNKVKKRGGPTNMKATQASRGTSSLTIKF